MKNYILAGLSAIGGAVAGASAAYVYLKKKHTKEVADLQKVVNDTVQKDRNKGSKELLSELITEMIVSGTPKDVIEETVKLSMDVIDSEKNDISESEKTPEGNVDYTSFASGNKRKEDKMEEKMKDDPPRIEVVYYEDVAGLDPSQIETFEYFNNDILAYSISGEQVEPEIAEHWLGYPEIMKEFDKHQEATELYLYNHELGRYFEIDLTFRDYDELGD